MYEAHADALFRYCLVRISDREKALDITQDVFTKYWDALIRQTKIANDRALLFTIARNCIIDWYRKQKSMSLDALTEADTGDTERFIIGTEANWHKEEIGAEGRYLLEKIRDLGPAHEQILYLKFVEGMEPRDIAQILGISENAASVRIHRGLEALKKITGYDQS